MQRQVISLLSGLSIVGLTVTIGVLGGSSRAIALECPEGQEPTDVRDFGIVYACGPIGSQSSGGGNNGPSQPSRPATKEISIPSYGAIARDPVTKKIGFSGAQETHTSKKKAEKEAIKKCRDAGGGEGCKVVLSIVDACAAMTLGVDMTTVQSELVAVELKKDNNPQDLEMVKKTCSDKYSNCTEVIGFCTADLTKTVRNKRFFGLFN
jgi:Domain of unknown function (DUF4189)